MTTQLDPEARALLGLALKGEQRLPRDRQRVRRRVLAAVTTPAVLGATEAVAAGKAAGVATGSAATGAKVALFGTVTWLKVAPLVVLGMTAGVVGLKHVHSTRAAAHVSGATVTAPSKVVRATALPAVVTAPLVVEATAPAEETAAPAPAPLKTERAVPAGNGTPSLAPAPPSLAAELEALQRAQRKLNAGNPAGALLALRGVSGPALRAERTALEVFANCALGNVVLARRQAAIFRRLAPHSPLLPRVDASCAAE